MIEDMAQHRTPRATRNQDAPARPKKAETAVPPLTGKQLLRLLRHDGWAAAGKAPYGARRIALTKKVGQRTMIAVLAAKRDVIPETALTAILGPKQSGLGKPGLAKLYK